MTKIKARLLKPEHGGPSQYKAFLEALHEHQRSGTSTKTVYKKVSRILADHPDLMEGFKEFLPAAAPQNAKVAGANHNQNCIKCGQSYHSRSGTPGGKCERCRSAR